MQAGPQPLAPGRALVRAARVVQKGRCGQAGGPGRRSVGGRDGGAASAAAVRAALGRSEEHTSELQSRLHLVCRLLLEKTQKKKSEIARCDSNTKKQTIREVWRM